MLDQFTFICFPIDKSGLGLLWGFLITINQGPDDGGSTHLWNVGRHSIKNTAVYYIPEDSELHTRRRENLKSLKSCLCQDTFNASKFRVCWDIAPCSHVEVYRRFRGAYCLHYQGDSSPWWWRQYASLKRRSTSTWYTALHSSQKTLNFILAAVRTYNLTF
jgi:hypothetical protein